MSKRPQTDLFLHPRAARAEERSHETPRVIMEDISKQVEQAAMVNAMEKERVRLLEHIRELETDKATMEQQVTSLLRLVD